jgi:SAM-dependent methyltransferase
VPEPDGSFDFAFSNSVLEHIQPIKPVIEEVARLLKPGGRFILTVPSASFHQCLRGPLFQSSKRAAYLSDLDARCAHRYYLNVEGWRELLGSCGLRLDVTHPYLTTAEVQRWETLARFTSGLLFHLFGKNRHPIEIQRSLGMRGGKTRLARPLAAMIARLLSIGLPKNERVSTHGCLLLEAVRE